jgi:type VI secretion system secreted protein VgrG
MPSLPGDLGSRLAAELGIGQATRLIQLDTAMPAGTLVVERFRLHEAVHAHEPLLADIDALSTNAHLSLRALMGEQLTLRLQLADGSWRAWHGYVAQAAQLGADGGVGRYRLRLVAFTHWLQQRRDTRIFQDRTAADIVEAVLGAYPQAQFQLDVADRGPVRAITTQHRETDWAFVTRLMAEEGWSWRLAHQSPAQASTASPRSEQEGQQARHTLVVFDEQARLPDLGELAFSRPDIRGSGSSLGATLAALASGLGGGTGPVAQAAAQLFGLQSGLARDTITAWSPGQQVGPNAVTLAAWDERQLTGVAGEASADIALGAAPQLEHYLGHGERRHADGRVDTAQPGSRDVADRRAQSHMAALQLRHHLSQGQGAVRFLAEGVRFTLTGQSLLHASAHTVLSLTHEAANNLGANAAAILQATDVAQGSYRNAFHVAPAEARVVPPLPLRPTAPGPQTATVVVAPGQPLTTDRDGRIRIQFAWQRGEAPLPGALSAPTTPAGADTGHAPGDDRSGTWVRVAQSIAGPNWGAVFTPRAGSEVLVDFIDGDIDRPIVVGQLHNGAHDLPWPAGVDAGTNHPGTVSGWHSPHLDGRGANQWLIDDATGQLRMRLASHGWGAGHNELTLGHLIQQPAQGGSGNAQRGTWLGEGFYAHTDGWAVVRAAQGLLLTTAARTAQGSSVASTQMDAAEAVGSLHAARQLGEVLSQSARQQGAAGLASHDAGQALQQHANAMCPKAQGKFNGPAGGQDAKKAQPGSRTLKDPVERFAKPLLHLDTPTSAMFVTPASFAAFSGQDTSLTLGGDAHLSSAQTFSSVSGQTTSLYTHAGGIQAIAANGPLSLRAHTDAQQVWSDQDLTVQSTTDEIRIQASGSITLTAGQSQIQLKGGDITFMCPGKWTVKGASHDFGAGGSGSASLMALPIEPVRMPTALAEPDFCVAFDLKKCTDLNMAGEAYVAYVKRGDSWQQVLSGQLDANQMTQDIYTKGAEEVQAFIGDGEWVILGEDEGGCC